MKNNIKFSNKKQKNLARSSNNSNSDFVAKINY